MNTEHEVLKYLRDTTFAGINWVPQKCRDYLSGFLSETLLLQTHRLFLSELFKPSLRPLHHFLSDLWLQGLLPAPGDSKSHGGAQQLAGL